jgi:hypothetical protein
MRIIVVNDSDGNSAAFKYTRLNLLKVAQYLKDAGMLYEEIPDHLITSQEIVDAMADEGAINSRGGQVHILEVNPNLDYGYNPFN